MTKNQNVVAISNLSKSFNNNVVLDNISLSVTKGQVIAIIGPSGSGKSTLIRCMSLLEQMDGGSLIYGDLQVVSADQNNKSIYASNKVLAQAKTHFGLVFQNFNLFPHFSVLRNITEAPICVQKRDKEQVYEQALALIKKVGLEGKENAVPCQLSGGQQQRVAIARALALNPQVLYFDEPTSALDPELTKEVLAVIKELAASNMTMLVVTHEMSFAKEVADTIVFMEDGQIVEQGPAKQIMENPKNPRTKKFIFS